MSPRKGGGLFLSFVLLALVLAGCASSGSGGNERNIFSSILSGDLSARPERGTPGANGETTVASGVTEDGVMYLGAGGEGGQSNETASTFEPGEFSLNFQNADIREVVQAVLGNALGVNYTIEPSVSGSVTISSARPLAEEDLIPVLEIVLQANGAALVRSGDIYRVVLETSAVSSWADVGDARAGYGISILPLRYVSAQTLINLIDGFGTRPGMVRAEAARNLLIILGNSADREAAIETALTFDADWMQDQSVAIVPLQNAKPETVIPELERIFSSGEGGIGANVLQFIPMQRLQAILVVSSQRNAVERARTWIQRLDVENADLNASVHVYRVKYRDAKMLAQILNGIFSEGGGAVAGELPSDQVEPGGVPVVGEGFTGDPYQDDFSEDDSSFDTEFGGEPAVDDLVAQGEEEPAIVGGSRIQADTANNSLVIYADRKVREEILRALAQIDVPQLQVAINVTMAEIRLTDILRFGVQYFLQNDQGSIGLFQGTLNTIGQNVPGFNFVIGSGRSPDVIISAFDSITDVQVLSSPSLVVVENETARFQVGDQIPIATRSAQSIDDTDAPIVSEFEYRDTGIILSVKPRVAENGTVTMEVEQEISSVASGSSDLNPVISNRKVESSIAVMDGQTVLLGGLISETSTQERAGVPGLSRIQGLGALFGRRSRNGARNEIIILIRPIVIRGSEDAQHVAEELRSRLWAIGGSNAR